uniref:Si:ch211-113d22.2 n=1 Tax=Myripristis murdjan TaxID=586833 RepID=A0A667YUN3_9TELE
MKIALVLLLLISLASAFSQIRCFFSCPTCQGHALTCYLCVAANEEECNKQGTVTCPQYSDACSTITGPGSVMKSCHYKAFCDRTYSGNTGTKMECCFGDDCNGPHKSHSHGGYNGAGDLSSSPILLLSLLITIVTLPQ